MNLCTDRMWKNRNCVFAGSWSSFTTGEGACLGGAGREEAGLGSFCLLIEYC